MNKKNTDMYDAMLNTTSITLNSSSTAAVQRVKNLLVGPPKRKLPGAFTIPNTTSNPTYFCQEIYIKEVLYNNPATIVFWSDNTKTVSKCSGDDIYNPETGLALCILKKCVGNNAACNALKAWAPKVGNKVTLKDVRKEWDK